jgi:preprotein translocase subunit Sec63
MSSPEYQADDHADYYAVLGVRRTATPGEIRDAFRRIAWQCHPDRDPGSAAHDRFIEAAAAFEVLSRPHRRACYDRAVSVPPPRGPRSVKLGLARGPWSRWGRSALLISAVSTLPLLVGFADVMDYRYALYALAVLFTLALARLSRDF